ncbi:amidase family protein [Ammoniphilus sp. YIM 78166]|uniref:amidase family protein n=1 Tax=Ammoniphilus sp. YIM 78166 TaxID=1644106 RepID=UPI00196A9BE9|nr:amidase family protein [Ammoniphilus sp. YIM 78166]
MRKLGATLVDIKVPGLNTDELIQEMDVQRYEIKEELNRYFDQYNAPVKTLEDMLAGGLFDTSIANTLNQAQGIENPLQQEDYHARLAKMEELKETILKVMDEQQVDALLYPHQKRLVVKVGEGQAERNGILGALTGFPSVTFPGDFSNPSANAPVGVPVGIELFGRPSSERTLIKYAYSFEQGTGHRKLPGSTPALKQ